MRYKVVFHAKAVVDIQTSFDWGLNYWGKAQAEKWARQFYKTCKSRLSQFPKACSIAPESEDLGLTIQQLVIGRYRVLFVIEGNTVEILYVRGAYHGTEISDSEYDD